MNNGNTEHLDQIPFCTAVGDGGRSANKGQGADKERSADTAQDGEMSHTVDMTDKSRRSAEMTEEVKVTEAKAAVRTGDKKSNVQREQKTTT